MSDDEYLTAIATLATAEARRSAEVKAVTERYERDLAAHRARLQEAAGAVETAATKLRQAGSLRERVDMESQRLWLDLRAFLGKFGGSRLGAVPAPDPDASGQPLRYLQLAKGMLDEAHRPRPLRKALYFILPLLGALSGAGVALLARGARAAVDAIPLGVGVIVSVLGAPILAVVVARWFARREGADLDGGSVGGAVLGALFAVSFVLVLVR